MGPFGNDCAPSPATTSTFPVVVVMLKNESIIVVLLIVLLVGGIMDFGNRAHGDDILKGVGSKLVVAVDWLECFPFEQQAS